MTLSFPFSRVLPIFGLSVGLLLQSASLPVAGSGNPGGADAKPVVHFTDIALKAGLTAPVIFGGENTKKYIIETTGTGVAIFDYDNDGWPDIFSKPPQRTKDRPATSITTIITAPSPTSLQNLV